ncbi:MAG: C25 family cysteine peptidase, partial [Archangium sp.]
PAQSITLSGDDVGVVQSNVVEPTTAQNILVNNYGLWPLQFNPGDTNAIAWSFADFAGWANTTNSAPRNPNNPLRVFLPNGYAPVSGNANAVAPGVPTIALGAAVVSGANPPIANTTTRFTVTLATRNNTSAAMTAVQFTVGLATGVTVVNGTQQCLINGAVTACTDGSTGTYRRGTIPTLAAGATGSLRFDVNFNRPAGLQNLSGPPVTGAAPNTSSWIQYTSNFATTETLGPVCNMVVNVGGATRAPTPARISGVYRHEDGLTFDTGVQLDTVGFRVFTSNDENGANRRPLHEGIIAATEPDTFEPRRYDVKTSSKLTDTYVFIEELQSNGPPHIIASMRVDELRLDTPPLTPAEKISRFSKLSLRSAKPPPFTAATPQTALKLKVSKAGTVTVTRAELEAAGLAAGAPIELFHLGQPVPFTWNANNTRFTFTSVAFSSQYTGSATYVVTTGGSPAPEPEIALTRVEPAPTLRHIENNAIYYALTPWAESPWFWSLLRSNAAWPTTAGQGTFDLPNAGRVLGTAKVRIKLLGRSGHHHRVNATINGTTVGSVDFDGATSAVLEGVIPTNQLQATGNQLGLTLSSTAVSPDDQGALGFVYLDWLELEGIAPDFANTLTVDSIEPYDPSLPGVRGVDYLIVTHAAFLDSARELAELKRQEGLRPVVIDVERAYDAFTSGTFDAAAVKQLVADVAARSGSLRYVLLVGDDTVDPRNFMALGNRSFIPSLDGWDGELGRVPSESRYADVDDDGKPDLAIGRLPVQTTADALVLLDKIGHYPLRNRAAPQHVVFVDQRGPNDDDFLARASSMNQRLGARPLIVDTATGITQARQTLTQVLTSGNATTLHYIGHGAPNAWTTRGLWTVNDSALMTPAPSDTIGFQWSCFAQWYQYLFGPSLGESLLLMREGGVSASFGPSGITNPVGQATLSNAVYDNVFQQHLPLGDAILQAKRALPNGPESAALIDGWNLLGDPAMIPSPLSTGRGPWTPYEEPTETTPGNRNKKAVQSPAARRADLAR